MNSQLLEAQNCRFRCGAFAARESKMSLSSRSPQVYFLASQSYSSARLALQLKGAIEARGSRHQLLLISSEMGL